MKSIVIIVSIFLVNPVLLQTLDLDLDKLLHGLDFESVGVKDDLDHRHPALHCHLHTTFALRERERERGGKERQGLMFKDTQKEG